MTQIEFFFYKDTDLFLTTKLLNALILKIVLSSIILDTIGLCIAFLHLPMSKVEDTTGTPDNVNKINRNDKRNSLAKYSNQRSNDANCKVRSDRLQSFVEALSRDQPARQDIEIIPTDLKKFQHKNNGRRKTLAPIMKNKFFAESSSENNSSDVVVSAHSSDNSNRQMHLSEYSPSILGSDSSSVTSDVFDFPNTEEMSDHRCTNVLSRGPSQKNAFREAKGNEALSKCLSQRDVFLSKGTGDIDDSESVPPPSYLLISNKTSKNATLSRGQSEKDISDAIAEIDKELEMA